MLFKVILPALPVSITLIFKHSLMLVELNTKVYVWVSPISRDKLWVIILGTLFRLHLIMVFAFELLVAVNENKYLPTYTELLSKLDFGK